MAINILVYVAFRLGRPYVMRLDRITFLFLQHEIYRADRNGDRPYGITKVNLF